MTTIDRLIKQFKDLRNSNLKKSKETEGEAMHLNYLHRYMVWNDALDLARHFARQEEEKLDAWMDENCERFANGA